MTEQERIQKAADDLGEHFDSVQIFATLHGEGTQSFNYGLGNWYARYGQVCEWKTRQDEISRLEAGEQRKEEE